MLALEQSLRTWGLRTWARTWALHCDSWTAHQGSDSTCILPEWVLPVQHQGSVPQVFLPMGQTPSYSPLPQLAIHTLFCSLTAQSP